VVGGEEAPQRSIDESSAATRSRRGDAARSRFGSAPSARAEGLATMTKKERRGDVAAPTQREQQVAVDERSRDRQHPGAGAQVDDARAADATSWCVV
jgi:hypothetical protein